MKKSDIRIGGLYMTDHYGIVKVTGYIGGRRPWRVEFTEPDKVTVSGGGKRFARALS